MCVLGASPSPLTLHPHHRQHTHTPKTNTHKKTKKALHELDELLPSTGLPLDDLLACALLTWFGVSTLRGAAGADQKAAEEKEEAGEAVDELTARKEATALVVSTFGLVFAAEWGDKSFLATIALAAASDPAGVCWLLLFVVCCLLFVVCCLLFVVCCCIVLRRVLCCVVRHPHPPHHSHPHTQKTKNKKASSSAPCSATASLRASPSPAAGCCPTI